MFFLWGRKYKITALYFLHFVIYTVYRIQILFIWKCCQVLVGMLHNVSKSLFCDLQIPTDLFHKQETVIGNIYCTCMRFCVHREHFVWIRFLFLFFTVKMRLMQVSHSAGSLGMIWTAPNKRIKLLQFRSKTLLCFFNHYSCTVVSSEAMSGVAHMQLFFAALWKEIPGGHKA